MAVINRAMSAHKGQSKLHVPATDENSINIKVISKILNSKTFMTSLLPRTGRKFYNLIKAIIKNN